MSCSTVRLIFLDGSWKNFEITSLQIVLIENRRPLSDIFFFLYLKYLSFDFALYIHKVYRNKESNSVLTGILTIFDRYFVVTRQIFHLGQDIRSYAQFILAFVDSLDPRPLEGSCGKDNIYSLSNGFKCFRKSDSYVLKIIISNSLW